jgi:hypothetical protein
MKQPTLRKDKNNKEELKKELIEIRHNKNEVKRQTIRKTLSPSSRFLDNYYNSGMHGNVWRPNGKIITKKKYNYGEMGLSHFYAKNNVLEKLDILEKKEKKKSGLEVKHFLEYDYMEEGDIVITIEHCSNCEDHATHTQHINDIYAKFAKVLQKCILLRYPYIKVYLKPIETDIIVREVGGNSTNRVGSNIIDNLYKEVRIGALEIQIAFKNGQNVEVSMLHSKLNSGNWPSISNVLNKIVKFIPIFNLDVKVYDKEEGLDHEHEENKNEDFLFSRYENIKINVYLLNHPQICEMANYITEELESIINPKKRKILLSQVRLMQKESYQSSMSLNNNQDVTNTGSIMNQSNFNFNNSRINTARPSRSKNKMDLGSRSSMSNNPLRPETVRSGSSSRIYSPNPYSSSMMNQSVMRPMSVGATGMIRSSLNISQNFNKSILAQYYDTIEDKDKLNSLKGPLIFSKFTDKNGKILLQNLPYDIYLLEIEDSKNFLNSGSVVKFNKIPPTNQKDKILNIQKFYGLRRQTHAYAEFYIYHNQHENENELNLNNVSGAEVIIRRSTENLVENNFFDDENKLILNENKKIKGRHEAITMPGKYILEVSKKGFDYVRKEIELFPGENKINVELTKEKKVKICVSVFNYETKLPIENANLQISYSKSDTPELGLTDSSGQFIFETIKNDDYVTVFAIKDGFYCCQRSFVKDYPKSKVNNMRTKEGVTEREMIEKTWRISEREDIEKDIYIYLVQEKFVTQGENFLMILYSNIFDENFEHKFMIANEMKNLVNIKCEDNQRSKGMVSYVFKKNGINLLIKNFKFVIFYFFRKIQKL